MAIKNRYEFVMLFDVENGNPNGDPDAGNAPRVDVETNHGIVTDVCLKRKIRNYVETVNEYRNLSGDLGYNILIKNDAALNAKFKAAYEAEEIPKRTQKEKDKKKDDMIQVRNYMCRNYFDVRTFGAVMSTGDNPCGIVRGPVQINFARSISPIYSPEISITRQAITKEADFEKKDTGMGKKSIVHYGLYRAEGYISAALADKTGLSDADVDLIWEAIMNMFEIDHSAARGKMCMRKLYVFKHDSILGNAPSHVLFEKIKITQKEEKPPRAFSDYEISVDTNMPNGVTLYEGNYDGTLGEVPVTS